MKSSTTLASWISESAMAALNVFLQRKDSTNLAERMGSGGASVDIAVDV